MRKIKSLIIGWVYRLGAHMPVGVAIYIVNRTLPIGRPVLDYLEFQVADHCNLNCAGCLHYSPYAPKRFASIESMERDLWRLSQIFSNIRHMRIMGGEPLLNTELPSFVRLARRFFPKSKIRVVTNGVALHSFRDWQVFKECDVGIDWTKYPPTFALEEKIVSACRAAGVNLRITENSSFMARLKPKGLCCAWKSFAWCRERLYCPILDNGRIAVCASARYVDYYNRVAGSNIPVDKGIDIYNNDAKTIMRYLMTPVAACAFCTPDVRIFSWKQCGSVEDWVR